VFSESQKVSEKLSFVKCCSFNLVKCVWFFILVTQETSAFFPLLIHSIAVCGMRPFLGVLRSFFCSCLLFLSPCGTSSIFLWHYIEGSCICGHFCSKLLRNLWPSKCSVGAADSITAHYVEVPQMCLDSMSQARVLSQQSGFSGLVVSMPVSGIQDRGFDPGRNRLIFREKKFTACLPSEGK
jgi:hypothetical protein